MSEREVIIEVTQEDYEKMVAKGIDEEAILKPRKHVFRRTKRVATKEELHPSNTKVEITIALDLDVLNYFKERTGEADDDSYKAQINGELRAIMEHDKESKIEDIEARLLKNKKFISALAEELKKVA